MHDFETFKNEVIERLIEEHEEEGYTFEERPVTKNNVTLTGITVINGDDSVCPTLYIEDYFKEYQKSGSLEDTLYKMWEAVENSYTDIPSYEWERLRDYEAENWRIRAKLVCSEKNQEMLKNLPHVDLGDLSAVFYLLFEDFPCGGASIPIHNEMLKTWGVEVEELYAKAVENGHYEIRFAGIEEILLRLMKGRPDYEELKEMILANKESGPALPMFVASNKRAIFGAAALLDLEAWKEFSKDKGNLFILPSSIHELIAVPDNGNGSPEELKMMVSEVNATEVADVDILSDTVYYYDAERNVICYADDKDTVIVGKLKEAAA